MLKPQLNHLHRHKTTSPLLLTQGKKSFIAGDDGGANPTSFLSHNTLAFPVKRHNPFRSHPNIRMLFASQIKAVASEPSTASNIKSINLKAVITVQMTVGGALSNIFTQALDDFTDMLGKSLLLELVSAEIDPKTGLMKDSIKDYAHRTGQYENEITYLAEFEVPEDFGSIGAIKIENEHHKEAFVESVVIEGSAIGPITISCNSWVHSKFDNPEKRVFFVDKVSCLPSNTPSGLKSLRETELAILRGEGVANKPREKKDRIYDYDVYNDLGDPDKDPDLARPVLGNKDFPHPRRCKTGRPPTKTDPLSESRSSEVYVPRDEAFSEVKNMTFNIKTVYSVLKAVIPSLETTLIDKNLGFPYFTAIDSLFNEGVNLPPIESDGFLKNILPRLLKSIEDAQNNILLFETPEMIDRDKFGWIRDEEFCRQTLAGLNPLSITLVKEWPLTSKLDPEVYGPPESAITKEIVERAIRGFCTLEEAIENKKLFMLDYHDIFLPYVHKVRELKNLRTTLYGSRTLMYLTPTGTLRPLAIELVRPPGNGKPQWKRAFTPCWDATGMWLWKLAKVHVLAHDSGFHQLYSHWMRTHCCTEPYIIATNRQLSKMHPIHNLLHPHFRYTMEINALAREALINSNGIIESCFTPGKYSTELSSVAYGQLWRFDHEALPADLIARGMAVEDPDSPHGLKLSIEDYPYANDGLVLWDIIKDWVTDYVNHYYPEENLVETDDELQAWWTEIRTVGHADKKDEPWWPVLKTPKDLIGILSTIIWVTSGHHAAVNFGQYDYAGYIPNRTTIARVKMPCEDPTEDEWEAFKRRPEDELLSAFPSQIQASQVMAVLDVLSNHSPDEEYIGAKIELVFEANPKIKAAYEVFAGRLKELEGVIDARNADESRRNRNGVGVVPYNLLKPFSEPGVTGMGVPNSISI
ncbi:putative linoleate 13S-lipoxygenase [Helianthus annuus]|uniref:Linoleate 13S-lipoxygenase n=1 Tax=Helianthus annuus TaxID=4232 RepID=A0A251VPY6_HELAN|nr:linoleate 13S-lipoxygenase 2-1, chloroplastic [Helianthus annuus]KAF5822886.1 putative linoleate 13S-lipoxygenase [Helianthus annuus]KAJ0957753.1 putative linoleate 13S-lipoxygenase [Helianthus annuus]